MVVENAGGFLLMYRQHDCAGTFGYMVLQRPSDQDYGWYNNQVHGAVGERARWCLDRGGSKRVGT